MSFVNLHTHSHFSQMDSISKPKDIVERVKEMGQTSVALTDHGTTSGLIETYKICKKQGVHFVFGVEGYLVDDVLIKEGGYSHICLWAKNNTGYLNLKKLVSLSNEHKYKKPRMDIELITKYREGLVVSSACMGGWLNHPNGLLRLQQLMHLFPDDLYIELHTYTSDEQKELNVKLLEIAGKYSLPLLAACDAHYVHKSDAYVHKQWITQGKEREDGYYQVPDFYLHSEQDVYEALSYLPLQKVQEAIDNTQKLADSCNVEITFGEQHYPHVDVPDEKEAVLSICRKNWESKVPYKELRKAHNARVLQEVSVLERAKYFSYFLIIHKIMEYCEKNNVPVGFSRGSAGGCDVAYLMGIHRTDPIRFNLIFERFLHEERVNSPDVDLDLSQKRREEVIGFIKDTYGHDRVFQARTYGYMAAKGALKRAGNALGYEAEEIKQLSKQIPRLSEEEAEEFKGEAKEHELLEKIRNKDNGELIDLAKAFVGILQTYSVHASAVIVFDADPCNYCAIEKSGDNFVTGYEFHTLEDMGILKLDILGIKTADVVYGTLDLISEPPDLLTLPLDDKKTFDMLCEGKTAGVFQAESPGFTRLITGVQPRHFEQYAPLMAVYRPAIIDAGLLDSYINRSQGTEEVEYLHQDLEEILKPTNGVMLFQEQLLEVARKVCGYTLGQADMIRRACGRKLPEEMAKIGPDFISRAIANGYSEEVSKKLWDFVEFFAGYGFNKCISGREYIFRGQNGRWQPSIGEMYKIRNDLQYAKDTGHSDLRSKYLRNGYGQALSLGDDGILKKNKIVDIYFSGTKEAYCVTTKSGKTAYCTMNHKFPTPSGEMLLCDMSVGDLVYTVGDRLFNKSATNFYNTAPKSNAPQKGQCGFQKREDGNYVAFFNHKDFYSNMLAPCESCGAASGGEKTRFELHHVDQDRTNNDTSNLMWLCNSCHKKIHYANGRTKKDENGKVSNIEEIVSIEFAYIDEVYDVEMEGPNHNLALAGGIVVSNSHSFGYGYLSYVTGYLKANYPKEFMVSLINSEAKQEDAVRYIHECKQMNIAILPPDLRYNKDKWVIEGDALRIPLCYLKYVGHIQYELADTFEQFMSINNINKRMLESLIKSGACDFFKLSRPRMLALVEPLKELKSRQEQCQEKIKENQELLDSSTEPKDIKKYTRQLESWRKKLEESKLKEVQSESFDEIEAEISVLGFSFKQVPKVKHGKLIKVYSKNDKNGNEMSWLTFETKYGEFRCTVFARQWKLWKSIVDQGNEYVFVVNNKGILEELRKEN